MAAGQASSQGKFYLHILYLWIKNIVFGEVDRQGVCSLVPDDLQWSEA